MSKIAFLYPGQGAQKAGMGRDFYENSATVRDLYTEASQALNLDMQALCFEQNDLLDLTEYTQAALVTTCLAMTAVLKENNIVPDITAGLSLGEYAAISAAGGMMPLDAVKLVRKRGILMQNTVPAGEGGMCAILSLDTETIEKAIAGIPNVSIANYNCPGQIVITGAVKNVEKAAARCKDAGAKRTIMLNVSGPFHSPMLVKAGDELRQELAHVEWSPLVVPYVTNVTAQKVSDIREAEELLALQVSSPVRWMQSMETLLADGVDTFVEIGSGKTLAGFMRKIDKEAKVLSVSTWEDVQRVAEKLRK